MSLLNGLSNLFSTVTTVISKVIPVIGNTIGKIATTLVTKLPQIEMLTKIITGVVQFIAEAFGLIREDDTAEELGAKAMESDKKLDDFDSTEEYIDYLRNEVQVDAAKLKNMSPAEKFACSAIGVSILSKGIEEKVGMFIPTDFWVEVGKQNMKADEVKAYIDSFKEHGFSELSISDYLKGKLPVQENRQIAPIMEEVLKKFNPTFSQEEIQDKLFDMKLVSQENESR